MRIPSGCWRLLAVTYVKWLGKCKVWCCTQNLLVIALVTRLPVVCMEDDYLSVNTLTEWCWSCEKWKWGMFAFKVEWVKMVLLLWRRTFSASSLRCVFPGFNVAQRANDKSLQISWHLPCELLATMATSWQSHGGFGLAPSLLLISPGSSQKPRATTHQLVEEYTLSWQLEVARNAADWHNYIPKNSRIRFWKEICSEVTKWVEDSLLVR